MKRRIAQGGMAEVYVAEYHGDASFVRTLAVKRILPQWLQDAQFVKMLQDEAKLLVQLQHRNVVQVFELFEDEGAFCISMEYVDGVDLRHLLSALRQREEKLPPKFVYWIVSEVLNGLAFAHSRISADGFPMGIVHRDISPQNILIAWHGEVKVADFGIAKGRHRSDETRTGQLKGKFAYMSPEQARGEEIDSRSDLFSVGVVLFEMLTGMRLFDGDSDLDVLRRVQDVVLPAGWEREVAPEVRAILRKSLKKNAEERFQSAEEMLAALTQYVVKHQCQIFGMELAPYLRDLFQRQSASLLSRPSVSETQPSAVKCKKIVPWSALLAGIMLSGLSAVHAPHAENPPSCAQAKPMRLPDPPSMPAVPVVHTPPPQPVVRAVTSTEKGKLSVQVRPWGYVTIPGVVNRRESPVGMALKEGSYQVKVFYEPSNSWLTARAEVKSGSHTQCFASFGSQPKMSCK